MVELLEKRSSQQQCLLPPQHYPWDVYSYANQNNNQIICTLSNPHEIYEKSIPELCGVTAIKAQCSGWLLLLKGESHYSLWNPTNSKSIQLPLLYRKPDQAIECCALSSPPGDPNCKVFLFDRDSKSVIFIRPEAGADHNKWVEIPCGQMLRDMGVTHDVEDYDFLRDCVSCNGKIYAMTFSRGNLVTIDVDKDDHLIIEPLPLTCQRPTGMACFYGCRSFLAEICGELFFVKIDYGGIESLEVIQVLVFNLDLVRMVWSRTNNLMGHAIFYDIYHAFSCAAHDGNGVECDTIYFVSGHDKESFYSFNVKDYHLKDSLPCPTLPTSLSSPMFLMPRSNLRLSGNHNLVENNNLGKEKQDAECSEKIHEKEGSMEENIEVAITKFGDLPFDVLSLIADCLNLFDYSMRFSAVSRDCRLAAPPLERKQALEKLKTSLPLSPWLIFPSNHKTVHSFLDPKHAYRFLMSIPEPLVETQLYFSKNGWLMMSDGWNTVSFHNPFTKEIIDLTSQVPPLFVLCSTMGFSSSPNSPDCLVVGFKDFNSFEDAIDVLFAEMGKGEWHHVRLENEIRLNHSCPVFLDRACYSLGQEGDLLVLDYEEGIDDNNIEWEFLHPTKPCESYQQNFILEWDGNLASVFVGHGGKWVQVFRLNMSTLSWENVESLGNYNFYVSRLSCFAIETRTIGMQNRIYFPRVDGDNILYYSLKTRKFHYDGQSHCLENFHNTKEQIWAGWFDPRYM